MHDQSQRPSPFSEAPSSTRTEGETVFNSGRRQEIDGKSDARLL
jgi:hypothetical protein